ncbi:MAG: hypothetical protein ABR589_11550 [Chthoniobacterales bacterium]
MKPAIQNPNTNSRRDIFAPARKGSAWPKTDYHFQGPVADFSGRCEGKGGPSFRGISKDYFNREARSHFATEAAFFALIVMTAAVPVIEGVRGLAQFVYGVL